MEKYLLLQFDIKCYSLLVTTNDIISFVSAVQAFRGKITIPTINFYRSLSSRHFDAKRHYPRCRSVPSLVVRRPHGRASTFRCAFHFYSHCFCSPARFFIPWVRFGLARFPFVFCFFGPIFPPRSGRHSVGLFLSRPNIK